MTDTALAPETEKPVDLRLQECAAMCLKSLDAWKKDQKDTEAREKLMEAVHELRKVASRIEIDIAMVERVNTNAKRIPIPEHKSKMENNKDQKPLSEILPVAEIKKVAAKKKIEIEDINEDNDEDICMSKESQTEEVSENSTKKRRQRRKKMDNPNIDN